MQSLGVVQFGDRMSNQKKCKSARAQIAAGKLEQLQAKLQNVRAQRMHWQALGRRAHSIMQLDMWSAQWLCREAAAGTRRQQDLYYLEGHGDLVSGLIMGKIGVTILLIGVINLRTKSTRP